MRAVLSRICFLAASQALFTKVEEQAIFSQEKTPGITDSRGNGLRLLEEMVASTKAALPSDVDPIEVPIYLGATAGMRIIDPAVQTDIMSQIRSLQTHTVTINAPSQTYR